MMRQSWFISALMMGGTVALAPSASAQIVPVPFVGSVPGVCNYEVLRPGTLEYELGFSGEEASGFSSGGPFDGGGPQGEMAEVELNCNGSASISVDFPEKVAGPTTGTPIAQDAFVEGVNGSPIFASQGNSGRIGGGARLGVGMFVRYANPLPGGTYNYNVNVLVAPE
jgi:hypothetical protein